MQPPNAVTAYSPRTPFYGPAKNIQKQKRKRLQLVAARRLLADVSKSRNLAAKYADRTSMDMGDVLMYPLLEESRR